MSTGAESVTVGVTGEHVGTLAHQMLKETQILVFSTPSSNQLIDMWLRGMGIKFFLWVKFLDLRRKMSYPIPQSMCIRSKEFVNLR